MIETGDPVEAIIEAGGYGMVSDRDAIAAAVDAALAANPKAVDDLKGGKKKPEAVKGFLRGQVMKQTGGKADPALVGELLDAKLAELAAVSGRASGTSARPAYPGQTLGPTRPTTPDHGVPMTRSTAERS